ncbi:MAG: hypothetical protein ACOC2W_00675 [bacterium]
MENKSYVFSDDKFKKVYNLLDSKGFLDDIVVDNIVDNTINEDELYQLMSNYELDDIEVVRNITKGKLLEYLDCEEHDVYYTKSYILTKDGVKTLISPEGYGMKINVTPDRMDEIEQNTSINSIIEHFQWDLKKTPVDEETLNEIIEIFLSRN